MSLTVLADACIGCGACDYSCPTGALTKTDSFLGVFEIDPLTCDDCGRCVPLCPEAAIVPAPGWPTCHGRGCPLTSRRLAGIECAVWRERCPTCGTTMWRQAPAGAGLPTAAASAADGEAGWSCPSCGFHLAVHCPKDRLVAAGGPGQ